MVEEVAGGGIEAGLVPKLACRRYRDVGRHRICTAELTHTGAHLAEDLRFPEDGRIESGGHRGKVEDGCKALQPAVWGTEAAGARCIGFDPLAGFDQRSAGVGFHDLASERINALPVGSSEAP
jgi:hypothetical protein